ncbi:PUA domain-containing protein [Halonotius pteroides]|uniref:RNA-binding protein n=1 Tax=Halonotius pteroides TaxID=268735 RepID=A0A3A6Q995_9EURY|nr:RNA-binding protein [Halonotius pteroides]RJX48612.1 RNA-binding protein [Halonotius pteroides]
MQVSSRHHLRSDAIDDLTASLADALGVDIEGDTFELVELDNTAFDIVLVDGEKLVASVDDEPFLTVEGANEYPPQRGLVTVDAGAIEFVSNGADVMRPGIVEIDDRITAGDLVAIAEETHGKTLAVGRAQTDSDDMLGDAGKVVDSIHHVGDDLYEFSV